MKLGIIIPLIEEELEGFFSSIKKVQLNLKLALINNYEILVVLQSKNNIKLPKIQNLKFEITSFYSVSNARNIGLDRFQSNCDYIYLLDQDAVPSVELLIESKINMDLKIAIWSGKINWIDETNNVLILSNNKFNNLTPFTIPYRSFLGCYFFKSELISFQKIRFNLHLGPGEDTKLKTGEDILFLCDYFSRNNINSYKSYPNLYVHHPQRPTNNHKTLLYLEGQIAIYKHLVANKKMLFKIRIGSIIYLFLFLANGFVKFLKLEENGLIILKRRLFYIFNKFDIHNSKF
jgi:hypothetical protein